MEQISFKDINGKTIKDCRFYEDYITLLFDDDTFIHIVYDFDSDEGVGYWDDYWINVYIDDTGYVLPQYATGMFWPGSHSNAVPNEKIRGPYELGVIKCNETDLLSIIEENHKRQLEWKRRSMMDLASEFGIELTDEQKEQINKMIL